MLKHNVTEATTTTTPTTKGGIISNKRIQSLETYIDELGNRASFAKYKSTNGMIDVGSLYSQSKRISNLMEGLARQRGVNVSDIKAIDMRRGLIVRKTGRKPQKSKKKHQ